MNKSLIGGFFLAALLHIANSSAEGEFGALPIGYKINHINKVVGRRIGECAPDDCEILGRDKVRYTVFGGFITRKRVLRAEAGRRMPFGLYETNGRHDAINIIKKHFKMTNGRLAKSEFNGMVRISGQDTANIYIDFSPDGRVKEFGITLGETG